MGLLGIVNRWFLLRGLPLLRRIPIVRDLPLVHGYFWVRSFDIPESDRLHLENALAPGTVAFIGPNHPKFGTDWMVDKEISTLVAPHMASWADRGIVAGAPRVLGDEDRLLRRGWQNILAIMLPRPFGPRVVHVGVPYAIRVSSVAPAHAKDYETSLLEHARTRMQEKLDGINARIAPEVARFAHPNPFAGNS